MTAAIKVENLNKRYIINHKNGSNHYTTFSESILTSGKNIAKKIIHPFRKKDFEINTQEEFWALNDINFEIEQGDKIGIIGKNGAGKSTLLKVLSRITEPTSGKIKINGRIASLLEVGTGFHPELSGRENIYLNGAILGMSRREISRKFAEIVDFSGVEKFLDTPVKRYSSGMYVRLAFSVAAHLDPDILIVDEVLAVGDAEFQKKCLGKMEEVGNQGRTVIFVSHNMGSIKQLCQKVVLLNAGKVEGVYLANEGINKYYEINSAKDSFEAAFPNDLEKPICIRSVKLSSKDTPIDKGFYEYSDPIGINIEYQVNDEITNARFGCRIHNQNGIVLSTFDTDLNPERYSQRLPGLYSAVLELPNKLLNEGVYYVTILTSIPAKKILDIKEQVISFSITDETSALKQNRSESRPGTCFLEIPWNLSKID